jgi:dimethylamine/trimethylamine dehydrogenase
MMPRDSRCDVLFEPVAIGPVTTRNRFYQVPHCNGMGYRDPTALATMRGIKAEGGWAVVCTEQVELHHSSEITPFIELRLWDDRDVPMLARMADAVHAHGALAGIELCCNGMNRPNLYSREVPIARPTCRSRRSPTSREPGCSQAQRLLPRHPAPDRAGRRVGCHLRLRHLV